MDRYGTERLQRLVREKTGRELQVIYLEEIGSTNTWAGEYVKEHDVDDIPVLVIANSQTAGKGRLGHTWKAQPGENISMSLVFSPKMEMQRIPQITLAAGIAVRRALTETTGIEPWIKWPNDILVKCNDEGAAAGPAGDFVKYRKLCGILCAMARDKVICGIGINVHTLHFSEELSAKASSVDLCSGKFNDRTRIAAEVSAELMTVLDILRAEGWSALKEEYDNHCVNREGRVLLTDHVNPSGKKTGNAYGTDEEGRLRVTWDDGTGELLDAGEIDLI